MTETGDGPIPTTKTLLCRRCGKTILKLEDVVHFELGTTNIKGDYHRACWDKTAANVKKLHDALTGTNEQWHEYLNTR